MYGGCQFFMMTALCALHYVCIADMICFVQNNVYPLRQNAGTLIQHAVRVHMIRRPVQSIVPKAHLKCHDLPHMKSIHQALCRSCPLQWHVQLNGLNEERVEVAVRQFTNSHHAAKGTHF